ncbi:uL30 family ribosomal protein [Candidatus Pacearchaeota archaeon]|nr:uL30 family ribosomal protein [Candidatus Pacearchaeota archaeon]
MIAVIRIKGLVGIPIDIKDTLDKLRLRRKYACVVLEEKRELIGMVEKVRDYVAYGKISDEDYKELVKKRGKKIKGKEYKPFFRLHPPRGGIKSKLHYPKGVLGNHGDKLNALLRRML